jgi:hypothetical protein
MFQDREIMQIIVFTSLYDPPNWLQTYRDRILDRIPTRSLGTLLPTKILKDMILLDATGISLLAFEFCSELHVLDDVWITNFEFLSVE